MSIVRYFETLVLQRTKPDINQSHLPPDVLYIVFKLYKSTMRAWCPQEDDLPIVVPYSPDNSVFITQETIKVPRTMLKSSSTTSLMVDILSSMLVPEHEHPALIKNIFRELVEKYSSDKTNTMLPIVVGINDQTLRITTIGGGQTSDEVLDRVTMESTQTHEPKPIPADKSIIEQLEKLRLDGLEENTGQMACAICMEDFEGGVEVSRLPCLHLYHGDCIVQWLETSHLCPLCRYPMTPAP
ncbi:RING-H2 finger protein ATL54-like [Prunus yedoensis var. nudiflora]|uniref:RING-type E3 ubiquitin transferase n=1 Tax=Prunus yedoensis var. nudiflora TaxID=2094558 RepID=A0A314U7I9_PRUYE|nr:RING-H2 finger protein ATL54-like [Prunus yedoensis var. nudiflora]PQQ06207.1 RING-H2 finger protein ATL54-like [Prunus yedoensis var. nudiflora]